MFMSVALMVMPMVTNTDNPSAEGYIVSRPVEGVVVAFAQLWPCVGGISSDCDTPLLEAPPRLL